MKSLSRILTFFLLSIHFFPGYGQEIFRFERMGSEDGLSQNTAFDILFDSKGFMWVGTMNGLNRYDGYEFKIFSSSPLNGNSFTNNRISRLWEDKRGFIWMETYDGYYHFFNPEKEIFTSLPFYEGNEIRNDAMHVFLQYSDDIIFLGSSVSGFYYLRYDEEENTYLREGLDEEYIIPGGSDIRFLHRDFSGDVWIGTNNGLFRLSYNSENSKISITHFLRGSFTSICETGSEIWFGTPDNGIVIYSKMLKSTRVMTQPEIENQNISVLHMTRDRKILAGIAGLGFLATDSTAASWKQVDYHSRNPGEIYEDRSGNIWLTAVEFGATRLDIKTLKSTYYELTPEDIRPLTDLERPWFFEDSEDNLWLGLHGSGLALYNRKDDRFIFFRNDPKNRNTISSDFVHCVAEDRYGQIWIGTGQVNGGIEKVILKNNVFDHYLPQKNNNDLLDNVVRAVVEDSNRHLWVATKAGRLHLYDSSLRQTDVFLRLPGTGNEASRNITYALFLDNMDYLWVGSKGGGLAVTTTPVNRTRNYNDIKFRRFEHSPLDSASVSSNNIYSICQDKSGNIWVGTYGNGVNLVKDPYGDNTRFIRINQQNSNLSNNQIRHLLSDSSGNLWISTTFGLNLLLKKDIESGKFHFQGFLRNIADENSLIYNDIIHIFEDSKGRLWFGTYGGGADMLEHFEGSVAYFRHFGTGLSSGYGIIFGILEDKEGYIWLSSENGLIRLDPVSGLAEIFNSFNGLGFNNFSENTCCRRSDGSLVFGGNGGFEVIRPGKIYREPPEKQIELTKFLLFNREVTTSQQNSPLKRSISFTDNIKLKHTQSSFGIEFSALEFLDPGKTDYAYKLDDFDEVWNDAGNQNRATYTNLSPGRYVFRVKSIEHNGISESRERRLVMTIMPPWWKTSAAWFAYTIIMMMITIMIYKTVSRINRYKNALLIEKKVNEYKLQFFTNISHEIRTPLTLIIGPLEDMLAESDISGRKKIQMEIMLKNARRMLNLTNQLLDFRKVQNNKMVLKIRRFDIVSFTREIYESFIPLSKHKGISCSFESVFGSFHLFADPDKLDTIIYNIISNALKFTDTGKNVSIRIDEPQDDSIDISVLDEGPGIPQKDLARLFTRYTILNNSELGGTGIGLSLSYELARLHKGNILVTSAVGKGSTFTIRLLKGKDHFEGYPAFEMGNDRDLVHVPQHRNEIPPDDEEEDFLSDDSSDKNMIIIVEDDQEILKYICQSLRSFFICIGARNGSEGLHLARTMNPDLVITDIMMPGIDGIEMTRLLKKDFNTSHIPVIILTSKADLSDQIKGIETGAEAYITKPFSMDYLKTIAGNLINQRALLSARFIGKKTDPDAPRINSKDEEFMNGIVSFIEENCSGNIPIETLVEHCNVSRTVLYNKIKGLTGNSPIDFVRKIRLRQASILIEKGYNVSEAAFKTGFTDVKYFSRLFKVRFGYPPSHHKAERASENTGTPSKVQ